MEQDSNIRSNDRLTGPSPEQQSEVTRRDPLPHLAAFLAAIGSLVAAAFAIGTGNAGLAALAVLLTGIAHLLPAFLDYQRTRRALEEARHRASMARPIEQPETKQIINWPNSYGRTFH